MRSRLILSLVIGGIVAITTFIAPRADARCVRVLMMNADTCDQPPCPVFICTLVGEGEGYCVYEC